MYLQSLVLLLCILYGSIFVLGKLALAYAPPVFVTGARMLIAGILLLGYQYIFQRKDFVLKKEHLVPILILSVAGVYLTNILEFWGLQYIETGKACFLYSFCPIATAMLSYFWFSEKLSLQKWLGIMLGVLGFMPLWFGPASTQDKTGNLLFLSLAEFTIIAAAIFSAMGWIAMQELVKNRGYSASMANGTSMMVGGILALMHSFMVERWNPTPISDIGSFLPPFLGLTLVSNLICYNLHAMLLRTFTATYLAFVGLTQPLFAAFLGWFFLNEVLNISFWLSVIAVSFGLYIYYQQDLKTNKASSSFIEP